MNEKKAIETMSYNNIMSNVYFFFLNFLASAGLIFILVCFFFALTKNPIVPMKGVWYNERTLCWLAIAINLYIQYQNYKRTKAYYFVSKNPIRIERVIKIKDKDGNFVTFEDNEQEVKNFIDLSLKKMEWQSHWVYFFTHWLTILVAINCILFIIVS